MFSLALRLFSFSYPNSPLSVALIVRARSSLFSIQRSNVQQTACCGKHCDLCFIPSHKRAVSVTEEMADQISKHDSSFQHIEACLDDCISSLPCFGPDVPRRERSIRKVKCKHSIPRHIEACLDGCVSALPCFGPDVPRRERSIRKIKCKHSIPRQKKKLDTGALNCYLQNIWNSFSQNKRTAITYIDSIWFSLYMEASFKDKVLTWIKKKQIFSKKYVFVPVICWSHWSLLILCNFGEKLQSETTPPCMLLLDSLEMANPRRLEPIIRKFVSDIFEMEGRYGKDMALISKIPLLVPKVPQQINGEDCGRYVLYYMNLFMESAPDTFSIKDFPYFMETNWFSHEDVEHFFEKLHVDRR